MTDLSALIACTAGAGLFLWLALRARKTVGAGAGKARRGSRLKALGALLRPQGDEAIEALKSKAMRAGLYDRDDVDLFLSLRVMVLVAGAGLLLLVVTQVESSLSRLFLLPALTLAALSGPGIWLERRARARQAAIADSLPDALDLLAVCLEAGLGLQQALERVTSGDEERDDLLAQELQLVQADLRVGMPVERAFSRFAARIGGHEAGGLAALLAKSSSLGAKIGGLLRDHARSMRRSYLVSLEESSGKANAKLSLPLTLCLLPAAMLLLLAPPFIVLFRLW